MWVVLGLDTMASGLLPHGLDFPGLVVLDVSLQFVIGHRGLHRAASASQLT